MTTIKVVVEGVWLTDITDPTVSVHSSFSDRTSHRETAGEVRTYAGGRTRVITSARKTATFPVTMQLLSDADEALLDTWHGRILLLRDSAGRREFGTIFASDSEDIDDPGGTLHDVALVLTRVTYIEGV